MTSGVTSKDGKRLARSSNLKDVLGPDPFSQPWLIGDSLFLISLKKRPKEPQLPWALFKIGSSEKGFAF